MKKENSNNNTKHENRLIDEIIESRKIKEDITELSAEEMEKERKKARNTLIFRILFIGISILVIALIFIFEFKNEDLAGLGAVIKNSSTSYLLIFAVASLFLVTILQSLRMSLISKKYTGKLRPILSYKVTAIARYYDNLTPSSIGGQPSQIYYLHKNGISGSDSSGMTVVYFLAFQFAYVLLGIIFFAANNKMINYGALNILGYVGLTLHAIFPIALIIVSLNSKAFRAIMNFFITIGVKLHLIKKEKKEAIVNKTYASLLKYADKLAYMLKHFFTNFLPQILITACEILIYATIPYFVILALGGNAEYNWFDYITVYMFMHSIAAIMPTPGMTGGAEVVFLTTFSVFLKGSPLFWAMVIWRFLTFYFYLIQGLIITIVDNVKSSAKKRKAVKNELANTESIESGNVTDNS